jgi:TetR/AcrR family transcriptional regulator, transcriptional repressor for nem operon
MANNGTREKIIRAAYSRFYEFGYNGTSIQDIVDEAKVPKGTFYNYFKSKELLTIEVLKLYCFEMNQAYASPYCAESKQLDEAPALSPTKLIRAKFEAMLAFTEAKVFGRGCLMGNFVMESAALPPSFRALIAKAFKRWIDGITDLLRQAQSSGEIDSSYDPEELGRYLFNSWQGSMLQRKVTKSALPVEDFYRFTFDRLLIREDSKNGQPKVKRTRLSTVA